jgi:hypothetical protein
MTVEVERMLQAWPSLASLDAPTLERLAVDAGYFGNVVLEISERERGQLRHPVATGASVARASRPAPSTGRSGTRRDDIRRGV